MMKSMLVFGFLLLPALTSGQDGTNWPSNAISHSSENKNQSEGFEYYESGNLFAQGPLKKNSFKQGVKLTEDKKQVYDTIYDYLQSGAWTVYYDSTIRIIKSQGVFIDGKKNGLWKLFNKQGRLRSEYIFVDDLIKTQTEIDLNEKRNVVLNRTDATVFILSHKGVLLILGLLPILGLRLIWNIIVWNKIYKTNYIPGFAKFKKGEMNANFYCMIIFWWRTTDGDNSEIRTLKKIGNWISIFSVLSFTALVMAISLYGE